MFSTPPNWPRGERMPPERARDAWSGDGHDAGLRLAVQAVAIPFRAPNCPPPNPAAVPALRIRRKPPELKFRMPIETDPSLCGWVAVAHLPSPMGTQREHTRQVGCFRMKRFRSGDGTAPHRAGTVSDAAEQQRRNGIQFRAPNVQSRYGVAAGAHGLHVPAQLHMPAPGTDQWAISRSIYGTQDLRSA